MKKSYLVILMFVLTTSLVALKDEVMVSIPTDMKLDLSNNYQLRVYHLTKHNLIATIEKEGLEILERGDISYEVIDYHPFSEKYYLISDPWGRSVNMNNLPGKKIWGEDGLILIKTPSISRTDINNIPYHITEMMPVSRELNTYKNYPPAISGIRTDLAEMLDDIQPDSLGYVIQSLQDFGTRYAFHDNRYEVACWIRDRFFEIGLEEVEIDSFFYGGFSHYNVVATLPGTMHPERTVLLGGHHDSIVHFGPDPDPMIAAPGADDNASSVAATLEIARIMLKNGYQPESSIRFLTFAAEEVGLWGSYYYASQLFQQGIEVIAYLNCDMISNNTYSPGSWYMNMGAYSGFEYLSEISYQLLQQYTNLNLAYVSLNSSGSDSYPFWVYGLPVTYYLEYEFSPHYHSIFDVIENCDLDYCTQITRLCGAFVSTMEKMPAPVRNFTARDIGNGTSLQAFWSPAADLDFDHYTLAVATDPAYFDSLYTTTDTTFVFSGLVEDQEYYIGIASVDSDGNMGIGTITSASPRIIPQAPEGLQANPGWYSVQLDWNDNTELDLAGYNVYRQLSPESEPLLLNESLVPVSEFLDDNCQSGQYYYYSIVAADNDSYFSEPSQVVDSRAVSLDQGLLLVDDTQNGNGNFLYPLDDDCDAYYSELLAGYNYFTIDTEDLVPRLAEMGPYSTLIWHIDSASGSMSTENTWQDLAYYLDWGGQLIITGIKPSRAFYGEFSYPGVFEPGTFLHDYLKISSAQYQSLGRFYEAVAAYGDFSHIQVDTLKTPVAFNYHLYNIESISPAAESETIFVYGSQFADDNPFGVMNNLPVGVGYFGEDYKVVTLSFPLYYMDPEQSRDFMLLLLTDYFSEMTSAPADNIMPLTPAVLYPNSPNPFNPETKIRFQLLREEEIELNIFNLKGQIVQQLARGNYLPGAHDIIWDGTDKHGMSVTSGIYFYQLTVRDQIITRKMILIK